MRSESSKIRCRLLSAIALVPFIFFMTSAGVKNAALDSLALSALGSFLLDGGFVQQSRIVLNTALQNSLNRSKAFIFVNTSCDLAILELECGNVNLAEKISRTAMRISRSCYSEKHPYTVRCMNILGNVLARKGEHLEAVVLLSNALRQASLLRGANDPDTLLIHSNLACLQKQEGRLNEAEQSFSRVINGFCKSLGADHPRTLISMGNLASVYSAQNRWDLAEDTYRHVLKIQLKVLGKNHLDTARTANNLAAVCLHKNSISSAEKLLLTVAEIVTQPSGNKSHGHIIAMSNVANLESKKGNNAEAEKLYKEVLRLEEVTAGKYTVDYAVTLNNLALLYDSMGMPEKAQEQLECAKAIALKCVGPRHHVTTLIAENIEN